MFRTVLKAVPCFDIFSVYQTFLLLLFFISYVGTVSFFFATRHQEKCNNNTSSDGSKISAALSPQSKWVCKINVNMTEVLVSNVGLYFIEAQT